MDDGFADEHRRLVENVRRVTNVRDERVLSALASVPRHRFVPASDMRSSYEDRALPLAESQTISQPSMVAIMLDALACQPGDRALEVGAGSGYAAALLSRLVSRVYTTEIRPALAERAAATLSSLGFENVEVHVTDGSRGLASYAPYQRILVSAGAPAVPDALVEQLAPGGRIAIPVGGDAMQTLRVGERAQNGEVYWMDNVPCMFVPLIEDR
jgi:protein-L-isoaspartate(D-aspartate) O-methyltransferase